VANPPPFGCVCAWGGSHCVQIEWRTPSPKPTAVGWGREAAASAPALNGGGKIAWRTVVDSAMVAPRADQSMLETDEVLEARVLAIEGRSSNIAERAAADKEKTRRAGPAMQQG